MNKFIRFCKSTWKNVIIKRKFKAFWMLLTDKEFRNDINVLYELTKNCTKVTTKEIDMKLISYGHAIVYPRLEFDILLNGFDIPPIKVVSDGKGKYVIVDGNHRTLAVFYRAIASGKETIICEVMS